MTEAQAPEAQSGATAGTLLRRAREAAGLHVAALAVSLKVPVRKLEALEDDRYELLTDTVFVRALASSVCRTLKIDAQPVLERLPQTVVPRLVRDSDGINKTFRAPGDASAPGWRQLLRRPVALAVFALLLGALVLFLLPDFERDRSALPVAAIQPPDLLAPPAAAPPPGQALTTVISPALAAAEVPVANGPPAAAKPATPASGIVIFRTKGPSWVEVTDAKGVVAVRKLLTAGEAAGASGALPLQVTIGRVDYTSVEVRGKPFDLKAVSRDNVARFEVK